MQPLLWRSFREVTLLIMAVLTPPLGPSPNWRLLLSATFTDGATEAAAADEGSQYIFKQYTETLDDNLISGMWLLMFSVYFCFVDDKVSAFAAALAEPLHLPSHLPASDGVQVAGTTLKCMMWKVTCFARGSVSVVQFVFNVWVIKTNKQNCSLWWSVNLQLQLLLHH